MAIRAWVVIVAAWGTAWALDEPPAVVSRTEASCMLQTDQEGATWVKAWGIVFPSRSPKYSDDIGMFASMEPEYEFEYRLSPGVGERLPPLIVATPDEVSEPLILLSLEFDAKLAGELPLENPRYQQYGPTQLVYEIESARLVNAELVPSRWRESWKRFDELLGEIVETALESPTQAKRERLGHLMDEAGRALAVLAKPEIGKEWRRKVESIDSAAAVVTTRQEKAAADRAKVLRMCMERLGMRPHTPAMITGETDDEEIPPPSHLEIPVEELGLTAHIADAELLREKMILGGIVIDSVTSESAPRGLQAGDVVLTCTTVRHLERWTWLGAGFPGIEEARAVTLTLRHITTEARQSVDVELAASAPWWKPYPFLVLRDGQVLDLRFSSEREERGR